jgi:hypothetical protein
MPGPDFQPGFRISIVEGIVLLAGAAVVATTWTTAPLIAFIVACKGSIPTYQSGGRGKAKSRRRSCDFDQQLLTIVVA